MKWIREELHHWLIENLDKANYYRIKPIAEYMQTRIYQMLGVAFVSGSAVTVCVYEIIRVCLK